MRNFGRMLVAAGKDWMDDKAPRLAAALSYYTVFSLPPLLVSLIAIAGLVFGVNEVRSRLVEQIGGLIGAESASLLGDAILEAEQTGTGLALFFGLGALLLGASGAFGQLQEALNTVWDVKPESKGGIWRLVRGRLLSFAAVLGAGFFLLVSLAVSTAIAALVEVFERFDALAPFLSSVDLVTSFVVITLVFALIFKFLPDVKVAWRDVWIGAAITSLLFVIGKFGIGLYLGTSEVGSAYGAAGSLIIVLVWIYYSSLILFFGAEFTQVWAARREEATGEPVRTPINQEQEVRAAVTAGGGKDSREPAGLLLLGAFVVGWLAGRKRT